MLEASLYNNSYYEHKLSHQHIRAKFWMIRMSDIMANEVPLQELHKYPVPVLIARFIEKAFSELRVP